MKIQKGIVKYKDRDDIVCAYGVTDDGRQYYFLDSDYEKTLKNGNRIASTALVEAVDPMVKPNHIGIVTNDGVEVIPFNNRSIRVVNDDVILVEPAEAISQTVIDANGLKNDPLSATRLVSTPATIKEKISALIGTDGKYLFNDQFSEATIFDINGNNLVNNEYYSFIAYSNNTLFLSKNYPEFEVVAYTLGTIVDSQNSNLDVSKVNVSSDIVDNAMSQNVTLDNSLVNEENIVDSNDLPSVDINTDYSNESLETATTDVTNVESMVDNSDVVPEGTVDTFTSNVVSSADLPSVDVNTDYSNVSLETKIDDVSDGKSSISGEVNVDTLPTNELDSDSLGTKQVITADRDVAENIVSNESMSTLDMTNAHNETIETVSEEDNDSLSDASIDSISIDDTVEENSVNVEFNADILNNELEENEIRDDDYSDVSVSETSFDKYDSIESSDIDIDDSHYDEYEKHIYEDINSTGKDSIIVDVAKSMSELLKQNKDQRSIIKTLREKLETVTASRRNLLDRLKVMEQERENLNGRVRSYQNTIDKLEIRTKTLEDKVKEQERTIKTQNRELEKLRPQVEGKEDLIQLLADAKVVLNEDDNW